MMDGNPRTALLTGLANQSSVAGRRVLSTSGQLRTLAELLRSDGLTRPVASVADRGATALERVGRYLDESSGDRIVADAERFGRQRPWVVATAGLALGIVSSRVLKATTARRAPSDVSATTSEAAESQFPESTWVDERGRRHGA